MYMLIYSLFLGILCTVNTLICQEHTLPINTSKITHQAQWLIVGAGPAGIATVGVLCDIGVNPQDIIWLDPEFNVGRLGKYYSSVPSNTKAKLFIDFINACKVFRECVCPSLTIIKYCDPDREYELKTIVEPLTCITRHMRTKVRSIQDSLNSLYFEDETWHAGTQEHTIAAQHVVLATGSHPRSLDYGCNEIPLDCALDIEQLKQLVTAQDTIVVVGSAHSAILLLKYLSELPVKKIINLYTHPLQYAVDMGTWILNNNAGLKGLTAQWAREVLEKNPPKNLIRLENTIENRKQAVAEGTKIIYAVGFDRNALPIIKENPELTYNQTSGVIAQRLFGIGIGFPEVYTDPLGNTEPRVGLTSFMEYAQRIIPIWIDQRSNKKAYKARIEHNRHLLERFNNLFTIELL